MEFEPTIITLGNGLTVGIDRQGQLKNYFAFVSINLLNLNERLLQAFYISESLSESSSFYLSIENILNLSNDDFELLFKAYVEFSTQFGVCEAIDENTIKLVQGLKVDGINYDIIEFGEFAKAFHQVEAEKRGLSCLVIPAYLALKEISRLKQSNGNFIFDRQVYLENLEKMSIPDAIFLMDFAKNRTEMERRNRPCKIKYAADEILDAEIIEENGED